MVTPQLDSDYLQQDPRGLAQTRYHRQLKLCRVLKNHTCVMQGSFHAVMHYAYASVTAWLLKT